MSERRAWRLLVVGVSLAPFVQTFAGVIVKNSQMALSLLLALAIMLTAATRQKKLTVAQGGCVALLLTYGCWIRLNYHVFYPRIDANPMGLVFKGDSLSRVFIKYIWVQCNAPYMRPWFWLLVSGLLLGLTRRVKQPGHRITYAMLLLSSLLYLLSSFLIYQTDVDFRLFLLELPGLLRLVP